MSRQVWVVQRRALCEGVLVDRSDRPAFTPYVPVRAFSDRQEAERCRADLEAVARRVFCPFRLTRDVGGALPYDDAQRVELVTGLGLPEPRPTRQRIGGQTFTYIDWPAWWQAVAPAATEEQVEWVWGLFEAVELARVVPMTLDDGAVTTP